MLQRVDQGIGSGSVSEWGPASSGVVRSAPVHTTAGIPALVILQYCHPKSCAVFLCSACANETLAPITTHIGWRAHDAALHALTQEWGSGNLAIAVRAIEESSVWTYLCQVRMALRGWDPNSLLEDAFTTRLQILVLRKRGFSAAKNLFSKNHLSSQIDTASKSRPLARWPEGRKFPGSGQPWTTSRRWESKGFTGHGAESFSRWGWQSPCASGSATWLHYHGAGSNTLNGLSFSTTRSTRQWLPNQSRHFGKRGGDGFGKNRRDHHHEDSKWAPPASERWEAPHGADRKLEAMATRLVEDGLLHEVLDGRAPNARAFTKAQSQEEGSLIINITTVNDRCTKLQHRLRLPTMESLATYLRSAAAAGRTTYFCKLDVSNMF